MTNKKENTCADCKDMKTNLSTGLALAYCGATDNGYVVPHEGVPVDGFGSDSKLTFWRIPDFCPRPDSEVIKSEEQVPQNEWVIKTVKV